METTKKQWTTKAPRKGQRVIVHLAHIAGGIPARNGGTYATYVGTVNGHHAFEGNTSDRTYLDPFSSYIWETRG